LLVVIAIYLLGSHYFGASAKSSGDARLSAIGSNETKMSYRYREREWLEVRIA